MEAVPAVGDDDRVAHLSCASPTPRYIVGDLERAKRDRHGGARARPAQRQSPRRGHRAEHARRMVAFAEADPEKGCASRASLPRSPRAPVSRGARGDASRGRRNGWSPRTIRRPRDRYFLAGLETLTVRPRPHEHPDRAGSRARRSPAAGASRRVPERSGARVEALAEREPKSTTAAALGEYEPYVERVHGAEFEQGAGPAAATLSLEEAVRLCAPADADDTTADD